MRHVFSNATTCSMHLSAAIDCILRKTRAKQAKQMSDLSRKQNLVSFYLLIRVNIKICIIFYFNTSGDPG